MIVGKRLTEDEWEARAHAYIEAADHLECAWTSDSTEFEQGKLVATRLRRKADKCFDRAYKAARSESS